MKERYIVRILETEYPLVSDENRAYVEKLAAFVDKRMREANGGSALSSLDAAILSSLNIADDYFKTVEAMENLRRQLKEYFDETVRLKDEVARLERELARLNKK